MANYYKKFNDEIIDKAKGKIQREYSTYIDTLKEYMDILPIPFTDKEHSNPLFRDLKFELMFAFQHSAFATILLLENGLLREALHILRNNIEILFNLQFLQLSPVKKKQDGELNIHDKIQTIQKSIHDALGGNDMSDFLNRANNHVKATFENNNSTTFESVKKDLNLVEKPEHFEFYRLVMFYKLLCKLCHINGKGEALGAGYLVMHDELPNENEEKEIKNSVNNHDCVITHIIDMHLFSIIYLNEKIFKAENWNDFRERIISTRNSFAKIYS